MVAGPAMSETSAAFNDLSTKSCVNYVTGLPCPGSWHIWMNLQRETRSLQPLSFSAHNTQVMSENILNFNILNC